MKCTMGTSTAKLKATPKNVSLVGKDQANIADFVSMVNVPGFGRCRSLAYPPTAAATAANHGHLTPMPCVPGTCPFWSAVDRNSLVCGQPALLKAATLKCTFGGTISIVSPGQNKEVKAGGISLTLAGENQENQEIPDELLQEFNSLETDGLDEISVLDGIQLAIDVAGMVPILGAAADLLNASISVLRGDWVGAGVSLVAAVPVVGDAVGGAKLAYKGAKLASKASKSVNKGTKVAKKSDGISSGATKSVGQNVPTMNKKAPVNPKESNVIPINSSSRVKTTSEQGVTHGGSNNVHYQSFDEVSKQRAKVRAREKRVEVRKVANGKYPDKFEYNVETKTQITNSTGKVGGGTNSPKTYNVQPVRPVERVQDKKNSIFNQQSKKQLPKDQKKLPKDPEQLPKDPEQLPENNVYNIEDALNKVKSLKEEITQGNPNKPKHGI